MEGMAGGGSSSASGDARRDQYYAEALSPGRPLGSSALVPSVSSSSPSVGAAVDSNAAGAGAGPSSPPFRFKGERGSEGEGCRMGLPLPRKSLGSLYRCPSSTDRRQIDIQVPDRVPPLSSRGKLYMFGGYGGSGRLDDFFEYDFATKVWTKLECTGVSPGVRENNGVVVQGRCLYMFGGYNGTSWLNDFHNLISIREHGEL